MKHNKTDYSLEISKFLMSKNKDTAVKLISEFTSSNGMGKELLAFLESKFSKDKKIKNIRMNINKDEENEFLKDLNKYEKDCLAGNYAEKADFDLKRDAYHNGDYYLEEFESEFFEENIGIQLFYEYKKLSDKYFKQGKFETAKKGYKTLIKIYKLDGSPKNLFIADEEFEEATLSNIGNVKIGELNKKHEECNLKIGRKIKQTNKIR